MIKFTTNNTYIGWEGINFFPEPLVTDLNTYHSEIKYSIIEYVRKTGSSCGTSNAEADGAILLSEFNNINIENCIICKNSIYNRGGAILISATSPFVNGTLSDFPIIKYNNIYNNSAKRGGGICVYGSYGYANIEENSIHANTAQSGGGIAVIGLAKADILSNSIFSNETIEVSSSVASCFGGGGILVGLESYAVINRNGIYDNIASKDLNQIKPTGLGGAVLIRMGSSADVFGNDILNNTAYEGGGIALYNGFKQIPHTVGGTSYINFSHNGLSRNKATHNGGGIYLYHSYGEFTHNDIAENTSQYGGGVYINSGANYLSSLSIPFTNGIINFENNKIYSNESELGGAIWATGESIGQINDRTKLNIINNLIYSNIALGNYGGGIFLETHLNSNINNNTIVKNKSYEVGNGLTVKDSQNDNTLSIVNNIFFYNNYDEEPRCQFYLDHPNGDYSFINNCIEWLGCQIDPTDNFDFIPEFVDYTNNNFRLQDYSPLVDLGFINVFPKSNIDIAGQDRINNDIIDIGAYEFWENSYRKMQVKPNSLRLYPNPTNDIIKIENNSVIYSIKIYNIAGVLFDEITDIENTEYVLKVNTYPTGVYFVKIQTKSNIVSDKFIKCN